jgi:chromosome segregation ATPase
LAEIASGSVGTTREDVKVLRSLTNELREELVKLIADTNTYAKRAEEMKRQDVVLKEDLITTNVSIQNLTVEQMRLQKEVKQMITDLSQVKDQVANLETEVAQLREANKRNKIFMIIAMILGLAGAAK